MDSSSISICKDAHFQHPIRTKACKALSQLPLQCLSILAGECEELLRLVKKKPYSPSEGNDACLKALANMAGKKLWPPLAFGSSFTSWYEHLGRCICFLYRRNHRIWESILKFV
ncbi:probable lysophospholipase BODYGUARD 4 [Arachis ipaensis]|uniref:probable lysophospholipase BODYGUARD 4 n=1 Tax=Arachis ipaensis TaxID=130454 RepID=UPI0007AEF0F8|nr:probable lysophospholipase BODYGUARD 4 [Arachis ipaensis]XP_020961702.1 probable lysophospholipase BODYGUARD 4 [Arachis ipaensis]